jgi:hypothetical protein
MLWPDGRLEQFNLHIMLDEECNLRAAHHHARPSLSHKGHNGSSLELPNRPSLRLIRELVIVPGFLRVLAHFPVNPSPIARAVFCLESKHRRSHLATRLDLDEHLRDTQKFFLPADLPTRPRYQFYRLRANRKVSPKCMMPHPLPCIRVETFSRVSLIEMFDRVLAATHHGRVQTRNIDHTETSLVDHPESVDRA